MNFNTQFLFGSCLKMTTARLTACDRKHLVTLRTISRGMWVSPANESQISHYRCERLVATGFAESRVVDGGGVWYRST